MSAANTENVELSFSTDRAGEPSKDTYNSAYNAYAQDVDLEDEAIARTRELEDVSLREEEDQAFREIVLSSMNPKSSHLSKADLEASSLCYNENDIKEIEPGEPIVIGDELFEQKISTLTEEEKKMIQQLRKIVEVCTQAEPIKRPTSSEILEMLQM